MNTKIKSEIAVGLILLTSILIGGAFWLKNKQENAKISPTTELTNRKTSAVETEPRKPAFINDENRCMGTQGYKRCQEEKRCVAKWETGCDKIISEPIWGTYQNEKYGFELEYPKPFFKLTDTDYAKKDNLALFHENHWILDMAIEKTSYKNIDELLKKSENKLLGQIITYKEDVFIDNIKGLKIRVATPANEDTLFVIIRNGYIYILTYANGTDDSNGDPERIYDNLIFNRIISTFKFIQ